MARIHVVAPAVYLPELEVRQAASPPGGWVPHQDRQIAAPVNSTPTYSYGGSSTNRYLLCDPMVDALRWYIGYGYLQDWFLEESAIERRLWDRCEVNDFIENWCDGHVFVQFVAERGGHKMVFTEQDSRTRFTDWFYSRKLGHEFTVEGGHDDEIMKWVRENVRGRNKVIRQSTYYFQQHPVSVFIENDAEAVHFKMRWSEVLKT